MSRPLAASALCLGLGLVPVAVAFDQALLPAGAAATVGERDRGAPAFILASAETAWERPSIVELLNSCLRIPGNMKAGVTADWPKESVDIAAQEVPPADVMTGVTQRAVITLEVPIRNPAKRAWTLARECFNYERASLFSTLTPQTGVFACQPKHVAIWGLVEAHSPEWPCRSRG